MTPTMDKGIMLLSQEGTSAQFLSTVNPGELKKYLDGYTFYEFCDSVIHICQFVSSTYPLPYMYISIMDLDIEIHIKQSYLYDSDLLI